MKVCKGYSYYGQKIGILVNASVSPRVPGDAGHAESFDYPVQYQITGTSFTDLIEGSEETYQKLVKACIALKNNGVKGIVADCGLMSLYQKELAKEIGLPFVGASLLLIPTVWQMIGCDGTIGIITGHSEFLKKTHLIGSGYREDINLAIEGLQTRPHFKEIVIDGGMDLDVEVMCSEVVDAARTLKTQHTDLKAIILECSNLGTYSAAVADAVGVPVFDTIAAADLLHAGIAPRDYMKR